MEGVEWRGASHRPAFSASPGLARARCALDARAEGDHIVVHQLESGYTRSVSRRSSRQGAAMDIMKMMKQAQEIQGRMQKMQEELADLEVEGQSGGGLVKIKLNGKLEARSLKIDPSLIKAEEAEMLEDLVIAAFQDAKTKAETAVQAKMQEITGGLSLPPGLKLPF
jgi:DNA-binding YbaB/EbfC family protein